MGKTPRPALTPATCHDLGHSVSVWCVNRCPGRDLDLTKPGKWRDRTLLDLAESGAFRCSRCGAGFIHVSAHLRSEPAWTWSAAADKPSKA